MPRGGQVGRWMLILEELRASRLGLPAETLARRHGWSPRTVYRDLKGLEDAGFPLTSNGARWKLIDGWKGAMPFPLSLGERIALGFARRLIQPLKGTPVARDFERLYERMAGSGAPAGQQQGQLFARMRPVLTTPSALAIDYAEHAALIATLCAASDAQQTVRVAYCGASRRELTRREIDPYHIHWDPRLEALYVFAWCHLRKDMRTFAVHRFRRVVATPARFTLPATFSPEAYLRGAFRIWRAENTVRIRLAIGPADAAWVSERRWHASQKTRRRADGGCELELTVDGTVEVKRFILQLGAGVEVLAPATLRREIAAEHAAAARLGGRALRKEIVTLDDSRVGNTRAR